jgi:hypothetical protein
MSYLGKYSIKENLQMLKIILTNKFNNAVPLLILSYNSGFLYGLTARRWINLSLQTNNSVVYNT